MRIGVSACLYGQNCKYNGGNNCSEKVLSLLKDKEVVLICPEVEGGLPIPRDPAEIVGHDVFTCTGKNVTKEYFLGAERSLEKLKKEEVEIVILQSRSPSCGVNQIYDGSFTKKLKKGSGIAARLFAENGIRTIDAEDL